MRRVTYPQESFISDSRAIRRPAVLQIDYLFEQTRRSPVRFAARLA
jgi:hypothetical protein